MTKELIDFLIEQSQALLNAPTIAQDCKQDVTNWLNSDKDELSTIKYINALKTHIMPIDQLIHFASSEQGRAYFGDEVANSILLNSTHQKEQGALWCDCPACSIIENILNHID